MDIDIESVGTGRLLEEKSMLIGKIERVALREVWPHEAHDFTVWLQDNIDVLNDALGLKLDTPEREQTAGDFNVDLVAEDESGHTVIIENQLGKSDHDHLGKLVTYLSSLDAGVAIWIVAEPRPEHVSAVGWLNQTAADFYLVKVEAIKIGQSPPAPLLTLIVGPSEETKEIGRTKRELAERHQIRMEFWTSLLERAKQRTKLHANLSPSTDNWVAAGAGKAGTSFNYVILQHSARVELVLGTADAAENRRMFDTLEASKEAIEASFGEALEWDAVEGRKVCLLRKRLEDGGYKDRERWPEIQDAMIEAMIRLEKACRPHVHKL